MKNEEQLLENTNNIKIPTSTEFRRDVRERLGGLTGGVGWGVEGQVGTGRGGIGGRVLLGTHIYTYTHRDTHTYIQEHTNTRVYFQVKKNGVTAEEMNYEIRVYVK